MGQIMFYSCKTAVRSIVHSGDRDYPLNTPAFGKSTRQTFPF